MNALNKQPTFSASPMSNRARRYAHVIAALFARQGLSGSLKEASRAARHLTLGIRLNDPTQLDKAVNLSEALALASGVNHVLGQRAAGLVLYQFELPAGYWEFYTRADVSGLAVGLAERRRPVIFDFDPPHALVAGTTGSGKSETLKSILIALLTVYTPADLGLILIDPHRDYTDFNHATHLVLPIAHDPPDIAHALAWVNHELVNRKDNDQRAARFIVIVIDEGDQALRDKANLVIAQNLAKQARKFKLHLLLATQKPLHADLPGILDNLGNRFVGQVTDAKMSAILTGQAGLAAHKLTGKGDFLHVTGPQVDRFQVAQATAGDFAKLPRAEIVMPDIELADMVDFSDELSTRPGPGRPALEVSPVIAARYFWQSPETISRAIARDLLGLTRDKHELHKKFVLDFITELRRLRATSKGA